KKEMKTAHSNPTLIKLFEDILEKQIFKKASKVPEQIRIETEKDYPNNNNNNNSDNDKTQKTNKQTVEKQDKSSVPKNIQKTDKIIKPVPSIDHLRKVKGL
ncbi:MAG: hypothetical protein U9R08_05395, partial [Nanoarchaeota archaeon]|nr:hypothetical protein [Nanoarchaeota archaeon]